MKVVGVVGSEDDAVADALVGRLHDRGRVARVRRATASTDGGRLVEGAAAVPSGADAEASSADTAYVLGETAAHVSGPARSLERVLDDLATDHDYAVVTGHPRARIPHVGVGGDVGAVEGVVVASLESADVGDGAWAALLDDVERLPDRETIESLVARVTASPEAERAGAIATFTGRVRARDDPDDPETTHLEFEMYEGVAEERMATIASELEARDGVYAVRMHHRTGVVTAGEDIVFVVVLAGHRTEAFATVSDGIDRLKAEVPIFKKEVTLEGEFWAHERE